MDLYYDQRVSEIPLLVQEVKPGEKVILDGEEQQFVDREIKHQHNSYYKDMVFPEEVANQLWRGFAAEALRRLAKLKLADGNLEGARVTCVKMLGLFPYHDMDWLLLAEILTGQGDMTRSKAVLDYAKKLHKAYGQTKSTEAAWKDAFQKVQDIIKSKRR